MSSVAVLETYGDDIAQLLRGERQPLSADERQAVLRNRLSYLADDLVISAWNASFLYDTEAGAAAAIEVFEFANSQLLEWRYHDVALESELSRLYTELEQSRRRRRFSSRHHAQAAGRAHSLVLDVAELTDRMENAVKFVGNPYTRATVRPRLRPARTRPLEGGRRREAADARGYPSVCGRASGHGSGQRVGTGDSPDLAPGARLVLRRNHAVAAAPAIMPLCRFVQPNV